MNLHVMWDGTYTLDDLFNEASESNTKTLTENKDKGLYQIYGDHPVYGSDTLLYIGKAVKQTFNKRINQEHNWWHNRHSSRIKIYVGRFMYNRIPDHKQWEDDVSEAERLLIYTHMPAHNSSNISSVYDSGRDITVMNYGMHRSLITEVSSKMWLREQNRLKIYGE
ncbi:hypothetical protein ThvES_00019460 [Thiovulum sp. ES]|nr:hypothetical protein ThvES_00019460 [Thiovulum sp. ES]